MVKIISDIYEDSNPSPVLTHVFYGPTLERAKGIEKAHMRSDAFFRAAMTTGNFRGIKLFIERRIEQ